MRDLPSGTVTFLFTEWEEGQKLSMEAAVALALEALDEAGEV